MNFKIPWWLVIYALLRSKLTEYHRRGLIAIYFTSYLASFARVLSWAIVAALVYRYQSGDELAVLMLIRGTTALFLILPVAIAPVLLHRLTRPSPVLPEKTRSDSSNQYLEYQTNLALPHNESLFLTTSLSVGIYSICAGAIAFVYFSNIGWFHQIIPHLLQDAKVVATCMCFGMILRGLSEPFSARLQADRKQTWDNYACIFSEILFVILFIRHAKENAIQSAAYYFLISSLSLYLYRFILVILFKFRYFNRIHYQIDFSVLSGILVSAMWVVVSQFADWLYAPFNQILMDRFLDSTLIADYTPAIQIDGALLLLIAGISISLFPLSAMRYHDKKWKELRKSYLRGTLVSLLILGVGAAIICLCSKWLFVRWFGEAMQTAQAILPFVLIHTVIGGTASIARSVLFGMGRMKPYAISAIVGGAVNAILATLVVILKPEWGLMGIIGATIITVILRCGLWLPWYTLRAIRQEEAHSGLAR